MWVYWRRLKVIPSLIYSLRNILVVVVKCRTWYIQMKMLISIRTVSDRAWNNEMLTTQVYNYIHSKGVFSTWNNITEMSFSISMRPPASRNVLLNIVYLARQKNFYIAWYPNIFTKTFKLITTCRFTCDHQLPVKIFAVLQKSCKFFHLKNLMVYDNKTIITSMQLSYVSHKDV